MSEHQQVDRGPKVRPGQIWLIEQTAATGLFSVDRGALASANVVLYDPALAPLVARALPIGSYAEALPPDAEAAGPAISPRALRFAADGWSVVQLVEARRGWRERMHDMVACLGPANGAGDLRVQVIAKTAVDRCRNRDACLPELAELIDEFDDDDLLTVVFGPLSVRYPQQACAFTANGLAG